MALSERVATWESVVACERRGGTGSGPMFSLRDDVEGKRRLLMRTAFDRDLDPAELLTSWGPMEDSTVFGLCSLCPHCRVPGSQQSDRGVVGLVPPFRRRASVESGKLGEFAPSLQMRHALQAARLSHVGCCPQDHVGCGACAARLHRRSQAYGRHRGHPYSVAERQRVGGGATSTLPASMSKRLAASSSLGCGPGHAGP